MRERLERVRLDRVPVATRPWIVVCWTLTAMLAVVLLWPGLTDVVAVDERTASHLLDAFLAPVWMRVVILVATAGVSGAAIVRELLRSAARDAKASPVRRELTLALAAFPALSLIADRMPWWAIGAALALAAAELVAHLGRASRARAARAGVVAAAAWLVLAAAQLAGAPSTGWTWSVLFGLAAGFAAFGSYYGIQRAAESRTRAVDVLFRTRMPPWVVLAVVLAVALVVVLRLTVLRELFSEPDPTLWSPLAKESPLSWLHAALVAGLIVAAGLVSTRRPRARLGERRIAGGLALVGNAELMIGSGVLLVAFLVAVPLGRAPLPDAWVAWVPAVKLAGVVLVGLSALLPRLRGTAARILAAISAAYLLPVTAQGALLAAGVDLPQGIAGFAATPVQILVLLVACALVLGIVGVVREGVVSAGLVLRLAVVPLIAVHAGWLLPVAWSGLGRWLLVLGIVAALVLFLPEPNPDPARRGIELLAASAAQLFAITVTTLAVPSLYDDGTLVVLGLLWLSVTVVVSLVIETRPRDGEAREAG